MERSGNFYKAIRLGYILISILIGCKAIGLTLSLIGNIIQDLSCLGVVI